MQKIFQRLKYWGSGNGVVTLAERVNIHADGQHLQRRWARWERTPFTCPAQLPCWQRGWLAGCWPGDRCSCSGTLCPTPRQIPPPRLPCLQNKAQCRAAEFKHAEAQRAASVYAGLQFGSTPARRLENMPCSTLACFMQAGSIGKWMVGLFHSFEYTMHNVLAYRYRGYILGCMLFHLHLPFIHRT